MMNGGTITGPQFFASSLVNYFRPDGIRFTSYFPFVSLPAEPARSYGGAIVDQSYRTGSVPAFAPLLVRSWRRAASSARSGCAAVEKVRGLIIPVVGALAAGGGVMLYGYIAHRYTADFLPGLIICGAVAVVTLVRRLERCRPSVRRRPSSPWLSPRSSGRSPTAPPEWPRRARRGVASGSSSTSRSDTVAGDVFGSADRLVVQSSTLPADAPADQLQIVGDCQALYLATGDQYEPWVTVEARDLVVSVEAG